MRSVHLAGGPPAIRELSTQQNRVGGPPPFWIIPPSCPYDLWKVLAAVWSQFQVEILNKLA
jgi:hypothetical protein